MHFCDITLAYNEASGGIKTYIDQKIKYLRENTDHSHTLIIPGDQDNTHRDGRFTVITIESPPVPGHPPYRFFTNSNKILMALQNERPDAVELGSFFLAPLPVFEYRRIMQKEGQSAIIGSYFHTDLARAYFSGPIRDLAMNRVREWSGFLSDLGRSLSDAIEDRAESFFGRIFAHSDLVFAAGPEQQQRLHEYGVEDSHLIRLGVDTEVFHPDRFSPAARRDLLNGAPDDSLLMIYAGRLDEEKQVMVLVEALQQLQQWQMDAVLVLMGDGPQREQLEKLAQDNSGLRLTGYVGDLDSYASNLASADIYVTAGPHETFGLSVVEAQASGLPVVGVDAGALPERVDESIGRLGPAGDPSAMAKNIQEILPSIEKMGRMARTHIIENGYSWQGSLEKLIGLYQSC